MSCLPGRVVRVAVLAVALLPFVAPRAAAQEAPFASHAALDLRVAMLHAAPADTLEAVPDPWLGRDKALHAGGSFLFTLSAQYVLTSKLGASDGEALPVAASVALALGLTKEVLDSQRPVRPFFSTRDLVADALGVACAALIVVL